MKKLLSLLTVSVLGVTSITNITAFSQAKTNLKNVRNIHPYPNVNSGIAYNYSMSLKIQLNASAWNHLLNYKVNFTSDNWAGFGGYLIQYADDNEFHLSDLPNIPDAVAFYKNNIIENYFGHFGNLLHTKSFIAEQAFCTMGFQGKQGIKLNNWFLKTLQYLSVTIGIQLSFTVIYTTDIHNTPYYKMDSWGWNEYL